MRLSARVDYALRAVAELAATSADGKLVTADRLAGAQQIPPKFLESILLQLRRGGVVTAQRGPEGGYRLARPADEIFHQLQGSISRLFTPVRTLRKGGGGNGASRRPGPALTPVNRKTYNKSSS